MLELKLTGKNGPIYLNLDHFEIQSVESADDYISSLEAMNITNTRAFPGGSLINRSVINSSYHVKESPRVVMGRIRKLLRDVNQLVQNNPHDALDNQDQP